MDRFRGRNGPRIDGDTISIRQQPVRIAAIDACDKEQSGLLNGKTWPCCLVARSYLRKMIDGKHVSCRIVDVDRYNRSVGQCFLENKDIGLSMVCARGRPKRCCATCRETMAST